MSSIPRIHTEREDLGTVACLCDSGTGEAEVGKQGRLAGQPAQPPSQASGQGETMSKDKPPETDGLRP